MYNIYSFSLESNHLSINGGYTSLSSSRLISWRTFNIDNWWQKHSFRNLCPTFVEQKSNLNIELPVNMKNFKNRIIDGYDGRTLILSLNLYSKEEVQKHTWECKPNNYIFFEFTSECPSVRGVRNTKRQSALEVTRSYG